MQSGGGQLHSKKFLSIFGFCKVHVEKLLVYLYVCNTFGVLLLYDVFVCVMSVSVRHHDTPQQGCPDHQKQIPNPAESSPNQSLIQGVW